MSNSADAEYVRQLLGTDYAAERDGEEPYPDLHQLILTEDFDFRKGKVVGERPNGSKSREGNDYFCFDVGQKRILTHRFVAAVALGKWVPRECDVDHLNHDPSDNRPENLRVVTRKDNAQNRRKAALPELVSLDDRERELQEERRAFLAEEAKRKRARAAEDEERLRKKNEALAREHRDSGAAHFGEVPAVYYTGRTKPAEFSDGTWYETNLKSWHLRFD